MDKIFKVNKIHIALLLFTALVLSAFSEREPKILIIGDSISIGYTSYVKEYLLGKAVVAHNLGNAQHTGTGLEKLKEWIGDGKWDIIQFNWGLWDLCYRHPNSKVQGNRDKINGKITTPISTYSANLDSLVTILKETTDAKLIFVTTTYVPPNEEGRYKNDVIRYNEAAKKIMKQHSITVNDVHERSIAIHRDFGKGLDNVHFSDEGYRRLGKLIADFLSVNIKK